MSQEAIECLRQDPVLAPVIGAPLPALKPDYDLYGGLIRSIIYQQLSGKAAKTIHERFLHLFPDGYPHAEYLLELPEENLRAVGLSRQKAGYVSNVALFFQTHTNEELLQLPDEELLSALTSIKGIGVWTVQMILLFNLGRPDVFPTADLGVQKAMQQLYGFELKGKALKQKMAETAEAWRPHRSYATRLLWQSLSV